MAPKKSKRQDANRNGNRVVNRPVGGYADPGRRTVITKTVTPSFRNTARGVRITGTDYIATVYAQTGMTGDYQTFSPTGQSWLGPIANSFSKYRVHSLIYSFLPQVPTTQGGSLDMGLFYDPEDVIHWAEKGHNDTLYNCSEYTAGPLYAGGAVHATGDRVSPQGWFGLKADCQAIHRFSQWLYVDPTASSSSPQLSRGVAIAWRTAAYNTPVSEPVGRLIISYDIEFIQPVNQEVQTAPTLVSRRLRGDDPYPDGPTGPPKPAPPSPPDENPADREVKA